jgi:hypothetical protein
MQYVIQPGDSLWRIADRLLGNPQLWRKIAEDNRLPKHSRLLVGDILVIHSAKAHSNEALHSHVSESPRPSHTAALHPHNSWEQEHQSSLIPGRAYLFVLADEVNPLTQKVVRRVITSQKLAARVSARFGQPLSAFPNPEQFGFHPTDPNAPVSMGRHAMGMKPSKFLSASRRLFGARRFVGRPFWIDVEKAKAAGATVHETREILSDLDRIAAKTKKAAGIARINEVRAKVVTDQEVLFGRAGVLAKAIKGPAAMALTRVAQGIQIVGFAITAVEIESAAEESIKIGSIKPLGAETVRQTGSWAMAWAGMKLGAAAGAAFGIETGPGAVVTAVGGALVGGTAGYLGFDWVADHIHPN